MVLALELPFERTDRLLGHLMVEYLMQVQTSPPNQSRNLESEDKGFIKVKEP